MEGEKVLLSMSPMKGVMPFVNRGKLRPSFIGQFGILQRARYVSYRLALPRSLPGVHPVFHVSMIRKNHEDRSYVLDFGMVHLDENMTYEEEPVAILDR